MLLNDYRSHKRTSVAFKMLYQPLHLLSRSKNGSRGWERVVSSFIQKKNIFIPMHFEPKQK